VTFGWALDRSAALAQLSGSARGQLRLLYLWIRWVIPGAILAVGIWWGLSLYGPG
jgi:hypothetical protein